MSCNCQRKHMSGAEGCKKEQQKEGYRQALSRFRPGRNCPNLENPLQNWECTEEVEKSCPHFKPFPPRMTAEEFKSKENELLNEVPKEFRSALSSKAYADGHSAGFEEIICHLEELVNSLGEPIRNFEKRIRAEHKP